MHRKILLIIVFYRMLKQNRRGYRELLGNIARNTQNPDNEALGLISYDYPVCQAVSGEPDK